MSKATVDITPEVELPVTVDSLKATMDDPTINHYKVIGLAGDWATTAELGDFNVEFVVPSKARNLPKIMFGEDAITELTKVTLKGTGDTTLDATTGFTGIAVEPKKFKIKGTIVIVDDEKENLMVITNIALCTSSGITQVLQPLRSSSQVLSRVQVSAASLGSRGLQLPVLAVNQV